MYNFYSNKGGHPPNSGGIRQILLIMKLTILILITVILHVSATTMAQKVTLNKKNAQLVDIFNDINLQTGFDFAFTTTTLKDAKPVTINVRNEELNDVLIQIFQGQNLDFSLDNKIVVIKPKEENLLTKIKTALNIPITISGKVLDETGQPMSGVTVKEKGTNNVVITDAKGIFYISVPDNNTILAFSYIGFESRELSAKEIPTGASITLKASVNNLNEVVINKGYYNEKQRFSVGDVTRVSGEDIAKQPVTDPLLALQGRVPGLYIQQSSGIPGAYSTILLRGQNSIPNGKPVTVNDPFFIVDGVPYSSASLTSPDIGGGAVGNPAYPGGQLGGQQTGRGLGLSPFNSLNPSDIESIEVLKDADATAIYGSRGSNGVILITTKRGKAGETKVDLDVSSGVSAVANQVPLLNTQQYLQMRHEAFKNDGAVPGSRDYDVNGTWDTTRYTNWQKVLTGNLAKYTNAQASVSGGNANTQFRVDGGYSKQGTVFPGDYGDQKASLHFNINNTSNNQKFKMQLTGSYVYDDSNLPQTDFTQYITLPPDAPAIYNADGSLNWALKGGGRTWINPLAGTHVQAKSGTDNLVSNMVLSYQLTSDLQIKSSFGYTHAQMNQLQLSPSSAAAPPANTDPYSRSNYSATTDFKSWIIEPQITYHKEAGKLVIDALLGTTFQENSQNSSSRIASGFSSDALITDPAAASTTSLVGYSASQYKYNAFFGRISARWKDRYLLNITARRDGSSRFGPDKQFGNFGAIGAGWVFTEDPFIKSILPSWIDFGKLRGSYGITGNDQIGNYQFLSTYSIYSPSYQGNPGLFPTLLSNPNFGWERDKKLEGGIDLGFLKDQINLSVNYYRNRTDNQLVGYPLPLITGFGSVQANLPAVIQNTGWEFSLNTVNIKTNNFTWSSALNLSVPQNKLLAFPGIENSGYATTYSVGKSLSTQYLFHYTGVDPQTGVYTFASKDGSGVPAFGTDQVFTKPVTQTFFGGFQNSFRYKGWEMDILLQFTKQTGYNYLNTLGFLPVGFAQNVPVAVLNRWQNPGDRANTQKFTQTYADAFSAYQNLVQSDAIISDASFIRLKSLSLSYQLPADWMKKLGVRSAALFIRGENLLTITKYQLLDPETQRLGLPPLRVITAGIHVSL
jgi:TonB-linked SusC/RagA family outer membrane protein